MKDVFIINEILSKLDVVFMDEINERELKLIENYTRQCDEALRKDKLGYK